MQYLVFSWWSRGPQAVFLLLISESNDDCGAEEAADWRLKAMNVLCCWFFTLGSYGRGRSGNERLQPHVTCGSSAICFPRKAASVWWPVCWAIVLHLAASESCACLQTARTLLAWIGCMKEGRSSTDHILRASPGSVWKMLLSNTPKKFTLLIWQ